MIQSFGFEIVDDNRTWGKLQPKMKSDFLKNHVAPLKPDISLCLDMDEVLVNATRDDIERQMEQNEAFVVYIVNLWEKGWRQDWSFWNVRLFGWKHLEQMGEHFFRYKPMRVHCGLAPEWTYTMANHAPFVVEHYGLRDKADRQRKIERYQKYDPNQKLRSPLYYQALESDDYQPYDRQKVVEWVETEVSNIPQPLQRKPNSMKHEDTVKVMRESDGLTFPVAKKYLDQQLKQTHNGKGFKVVEKVAKKKTATKKTATKKK